jgi:hypothetical protein
MTPAIINRQQVWTVVGLLLLAVGLPLYAQEADKPVTIITFDVPGAVNGTFPVGLNDKGVVTGTYGDNVGSFHSFVRTRNGVFTKFDPDMVPNLPGIINNAGHDHWILF